MKKIALFIACICIVPSVSAGLFEYNVVENPSVGVEKQLVIPGYSNTNSGYNSYKNTYKKTTTTAYYTQPYSYTKYPSRSYYNDLRATNGYYDYTELKRELEAELKRLERRAEDIDDAKRDIILDIRRYKSYGSNRYYDIRRQLEDELDHLEDEERYVEDMIDDLEDEIKDLRKYRNTKTYYHYDGRHYNDSPYYNGKYYRGKYKKGYYYYDRDFGYSYQPSWVNPHLEEVKDGRIYVK